MDDLPNASRGVFSSSSSSDFIGKGSGTLGWDIADDLLEDESPLAGEERACEGVPNVGRRRVSLSSNGWGSSDTSACRVFNPVSSSLILPCSCDIRSCSSSVPESIMRLPLVDARTPEGKDAEVNINRVMGAHGRDRRTCWADFTAPSRDALLAGHLRRERDRVTSVYQRLYAEIRSQITRYAQPSTGASLRRGKLGRLLTFTYILVTTQFESSTFCTRGGPEAPTDSISKEK